MIDISNNVLLADVEIPMYKICINVAIGKTCVDAMKESENLSEALTKWSDWENTTAAYIYHSKKNIHAIVISEEASVGTVAHECFHAVMTTLQLKGIKYSQKSEECFAYVLGYLTDKVNELKQKYDEEYRNQ